MFPFVFLFYPGDPALAMAQRPQIVFVSPPASSLPVALAKLFEDEQ